jgi:hypothetical protein
MTLTVILIALAIVLFYGLMFGGILTVGYGVSEGKPLVIPVGVVMILSGLSLPIYAILKVVEHFTP